MSQWRARWLAGWRTPASVAERLSDAPLLWRAGADHGARDLRDRGAGLLTAV